MAKFKYLTLEERKLVLKLYGTGKNFKEIAQLFEKSTTSIFKVINAFRTEGRVEPKQRQGRPRITTKRVDLKIQNISSVNPFMSAPKIKAKVENKYEIHLSTETIRRRLREDNKHGRVARRVPFISKQNIKKTYAILFGTHFKARYFLEQSPMD